MTDPASTDAAPASGAPDSLTLHVFPLSTFCDKADWLVEAHGLAGRCRRAVHLPFLHARPMRRLSGQTAVPVLEMDSTVVSGSDRIAAALEASPTGVSLLGDSADDARAILGWETRLARVGEWARAAMFTELLPDPSHFHRVLMTGRRGVGTAAHGLLFRAMSPMLRKMLARAPAMDELTTRITACLDDIAAGTGGGYLVGNRFSLADLTAAALLFPLWFPEGSPSADVIGARPTGRAWLARFADHPAGRWVETIRADWRHGALPGAAVTQAAS